MGCRVGKLKEDAIKSISLHAATSPPLRNLDQISEDSIKECSEIPMVGENNKIKISEDPSMFKMLQEL